MNETQFLHTLLTFHHYYLVIQYNTFMAKQHNIIEISAYKQHIIKR